MYCFDCMNEYEDGEKCPVCGSSRVLNQTENNPSSSLGIKMEIGPDDNYIIGPVANEKNDVVTYRAYDKINEKPVLIKEYFSKKCIRLQSGDIEVPESEKSGLAYYKNKVNKLSLEYHKSNDRPIDYFEQHNSFYAVFDFKKPIPFFKYLKNNRIDNPKEFVKPLLEIIQIYHNKGVSVGIDKLGILNDTLILNDFSGKETPKEDDINLFLKILSSCQLNQKAMDINEAEKMGLNKNMSIDDCYSVLYEGKVISQNSELKDDENDNEDNIFEDEDFENSDKEMEESDELNEDFIENDETEKKVKKKKLFSFKRGRKHCDNLTSEDETDKIIDNETEDDFDSDEDGFEEYETDEDEFNEEFYEKTQKQKKIKIAAGIIAGVFVAAMIFSNIRKNISSKEPVKKVVKETPSTTATVRPTLTPATSAAIVTAEPTEVPTKNPYTVVPDVEDLTKHKAAELIQDNDLKFKVKSYKYSSTVKKGCIIRQNVLPDTQVKKGTVIRVNISKGKKKIKKKKAVHYYKPVITPEPYYEKPTYSEPKSEPKHHYVKKYPSKPKANKSGGSPVMSDPIQ